MIEFGVSTYLEADAPLTTLLGASGSDSKIYPVQAPIGAQDKLPYIIYTINQSGTFDENLLEESITYDCISGTYLASKNIKDRVNLLLDLQDRAQGTITDDTFFIHWSKQTAGISTVDSNNGLFHSTSTVDFKIRRIPNVI